MDSNGQDDPPEGGQQQDFTSNRARKLFGTKGGAKPWDAPREDAQGPDLTKQTTSSSPYPKESPYAAPPAAPEPQPQGDPDFPEREDDGELTKLHPNYKLMMRFGAIIAALVIAFLGLSVDAVAYAEGSPLPRFVITGIAVVIALFIAIRLPLARYNARGFHMSNDRLRVVRGVMFHSDTIVPFGRVQHIDVDQGPIERALGIATMTLHTAGSHNASVRLPGLGHQLATEMREEIRAHIKRESV